MLHSLDSSLPSFKRIEFKPGVNFILAEGVLNDDHSGSANSVGKSSVFRLIDFLLGGSLDEKELPTDIFGEYVFQLEATIKGNRVKIRRAADKKDRKFVEVEGPIAGWPNVMDEQVNAENAVRKFPLEQWQQILGAACFDLPWVGPDGTKKSNKAPSARDMFSMFNRKSFGEIDKSYFREKADHAKLVTAYLLGLNWEYLVKLAAIKKQEKLAKEIENTANHELARTRISKAKLIKANKALKKKIDASVAALDSYETDLAYATVAQQVDDLTQRLNAAQRRVMSADRRIKLAEEAKNAVVDDPDSLEQFYAAAGVALGDRIKRRLEEVRDFHSRVQQSRIAVLNTEILRQKEELQLATEEAKTCDKTKAELLKGIADQSDTIRDLNAKKEALHDLEREYDKNNQAIHLFEEAERVRVEVAERREQCAAEEKVKYDDLASHVAALPEAFKNMIAAMYTSAQGTLTITFQDGSGQGKSKKYGIDIEAKVTDDTGPGKTHIKVCAFDLLAFKLSKKLGRGIDFLMHDTPAFEASDANQVAHVVLQAAKVIHDTEGQYICALDKDRYTQCCTNGNFAAIARDANEVTLSETDKLFGQDFN